jgi:zinc/manganese transport system substrate-binding protein
MSSRRTRRLLATTSALMAMALGATACGGGGQPAADSAASAAKVKVVASTNVWGSVVNAVGGDKVEVRSIINDPSADPHSYESTSEDALAAQNAQLTLSNGGGYDDFFAKLADQAANAKKLVAYDIAATGDENEHVWYSLRSVEKVADEVAARLGELQPASKQAFDSGAAAFKAKAEDLLKKTEQIGTTRPDTKVIATEPIAHYLLDSAKVADATPEEFSKAIEEESDPPAAAVQEVKTLISGKQVKAVVNNAQTATPITEQVVGDAKTAGIGVVDVTETLPVGVGDYIAWMSKEVEGLAGALGA